jgi:hypothetical protein
MFRNRSKLALSLASLLAALLVWNGARAEVFVGDTTDGPIWERPVVTGGESSFEFVPYAALPFSVSTSGSYTFTATPLVGDFDIVQFLYDATFAPATPLAGYLFGEDIYSLGDPEQFPFTLTSGATYYAVTTGYIGFDYGPFSLSISGPGGVTVVEPSEFLPGDFTENHSVDAADLAAWKDGFDDPLPATHMQGDADGDLDVDGNDFLIWQRDLGRPDALTPAVAVIPEPGAATLLIMAMLAVRPALRTRQRAAIPRGR